MTEPSAHNRAFELLPWAVNGSLPESEREAVEQHIRTCIVCRRELKEQQRLHAAVREQPIIHVSPQAGFELLNRELDETLAAHKTPRSGRRNHLALRPFAIAMAAGVAFLAMLLWLTPLPNVGTGAYRTLATPAARDDAVLLDVVFARQTTAAQMQELLAAIGGEIVAGPTDVGRYSVRISGPLAADGDVAQIVETLAHDSRVRFAGRSLMEPE